MRIASTVAFAGAVFATPALSAQTIKASQWAGRTFAESKRCFYMGLGLEYIKIKSSIDLDSLRIRVIRRPTTPMGAGHFGALAEELRPAIGPRLVRSPDRSAVSALQQRRGVA